MHSQAPGAAHPDTSFPETTPRELIEASAENRTPGTDRTSWHDGLCGGGLTLIAVTTDP